MITVGGIVLSTSTAAALSDATPAPLGTAAPGIALEASRRDHVHEAPAAADITDVGTAGIASVQAETKADGRSAIDAETVGAASAVSTTLARLVGAVLGVKLVLHDDVLFLIAAASLSSGDLGALTYSAGTLTRDTVGDLRDLDPGFALGQRFLFTFADLHLAGGVYTLTGYGSVSTGAQWTRADDFDASADFRNGGAVIVLDAGVLKLYRAAVSGSFVLGTDTVKFDLVDPAWIVTEGTP